MTQWRWLGLGLGAYVITLVATAPASWVDTMLQSASAGRLRLADAQGTLWSGAGQIEIRDAGGRSGVARTLVWRVMPVSLLRGRLVCEVGLDEAARRIPVTLSWSRLEADDFDINVPAAILGLGMPGLAPLELTGELMLHVASLSVTRSTVGGAAIVRWQSAGSRAVAISPLGNYEIRLAGEGAMLRVAVRTLQGPLQLDGGGAWTVGGRPALTVTARVLPEQRLQLAPLLRLVAAERGDGSFEMRLQ